MTENANCFLDSVLHILNWELQFEYGQLSHYFDQTYNLGKNYEGYS